MIFSRIFRFIENLLFRNKVDQLKNYFYHYFIFLNFQFILALNYFQFLK
jgi:hypothetical protein